MPADNTVRLTFLDDGASIWIGGEPIPIPCHRAPMHNVRALAQTIARRLGKRLVVE